MKDIRKDKNKRKLFTKFEKKRKILKFLAQSTDIPKKVQINAQMHLNKLPKNSSKVRINNRCVITGRSRSVFRKFKLSRHQLKKLAHFGLISGLKHN